MSNGCFLVLGCFAWLMASMYCVMESDLVPGCQDCLFFFNSLMGVLATVVLWVDLTISGCFVRMI